MLLPRLPVVAASAVAGALLLSAQTTELDPYVGRDLWSAKLSLADNERLARIIGPVPRGFMLSPWPWHIWKPRPTGVSRFVVVLGETEQIVPGGSSACVYLLDAGLQYIGSWCFQAGWRMGFRRVSFEYSQALDSELLIFEMFPYVNGRDIRKEVFSLKADSLKFIRLEDSRGNAVQNDSVFANYEIGFLPPSQSPQDAVAMLESADKSDVLFALMLLGGRYVPESERRGLDRMESRHAERFRAWIAVPRIRKLIEELCNSEDVWIRQAAELAARDPLERPIGQNAPFDPKALRIQRSWRNWLIPF